MHRQFSQLFDPVEQKQKQMANIVKLTVLMA